MLSRPWLAVKVPVPSERRPPPNVAAELLRAERGFQNEEKKQVCCQQEAVSGARFLHPCYIFNLFQSLFWLTKPQTCFRNPTLNSIYCTVVPKANKAGRRPTEKCPRLFYIWATRMYIFLITVIWQFPLRKSVKPRNLLQSKLDQNPEKFVFLANQGNNKLVIRSTHLPCGGRQSW